ncbi:MAG: APC family permease [Candidatus Babeliales bacterium]
MKPTLSLPMAIFININVILGSGLFINTVLLSQFAGAFGALSYTIVGILLLPLVLGMASLVKENPEGGFYSFAKHDLSPFFGFISTWSYFTAKLASATLGIHVANALIQSIIPFFQRHSIITMDVFVIILFVLLNLMNMRRGTKIQLAFIMLKCIPLIFAILSGFFLFSFDNFSMVHQIPQGIPSTIPLILYAFIGFEVTTSISRSIHNPEKNAPKAVLYSYLIAISIATLFQLIFYGNLGTTLIMQSSYLGAYPALLAKLFTNPETITLLKGFLHLAIASSALGSSYGIMFSNSWNLYTLAQNEHTFFSDLFTTLNHNHIAYAAVLAEGCLTLIYLFYTQGAQLSLQQVGAIGSAIAFTISALALFANRLQKKAPLAELLLPILAIISCSMLVGACFRNFFLYGISSLILYAIVWLGGCSMYFITKHLKAQA